MNCELSASLCISQMPGSEGYARRSVLFNAGSRYFMQVLGLPAGENGYMGQRALIMTSNLHPGWTLMTPGHGVLGFATIIPQPESSTAGKLDWVITVVLLATMRYQNLQHDRSVIDQKAY
ncbi:hypothetical protein TNCT_608211 [Trichonephila clavata]|uniref:Uncharacterized protein n=1 Tax=Trichonephila clavata TaxID=2740835 RepID=A0A8X6F756_TRICU|nr:hypothetical protein TNCT_608211 [Trichonephila clavata]